jgi:hypothetical protein
MIHIRHPEHAIRHRTILHASRRPRATGAHLVDHRHNMRLAFPLGSRPLGNRLALLNLAVHITRHCRGIFSHASSMNHQTRPHSQRAGQGSQCSHVPQLSRRSSDRHRSPSHHSNASAAVGGAACCAPACHDVGPSHLRRCFSLSSLLLRGKSLYLSQICLRLSSALSVLNLVTFRSITQTPQSPRL